MKKYIIYSISSLFALCLLGAANGCAAAPVTVSPSTHSSSDTADVASPGEDLATNQNPRKGWVVISMEQTETLNGDDYTYRIWTPTLMKQCDGATLIYSTAALTGMPASISAVANSPECAE